MNIIENKKFIIQDIKNELNRKQMKLIQYEIGSIEYEQNFFEIETLKSELELAMNLDSFDDGSIKRIIELLKKYEHILELPKEKIIQLTNLIEEFKDSKDLADIKVNIPSNIQEIYEYPYKRIANLEELNNFRNNVLSSKISYEEEAKKLKEKLGIIDIESYNKLFQNVKNGTISNIKDLLKLSNLGVDNALSHIKKLHKDLKVWKIVNNILNVFEKEEQYEFTKSIKEDILKWEKYLLEEANTYIKYLISYNKVVNINLENEENINLSSTYLKIQDMIKEKDKSYAIVLAACARIEDKLNNGDIQLINLLGQIDQTIVEKIKSSGINPEELTKSKLTRLFAHKNLMNRLSYIKEKEQGAVLKKV